LRRGKKGDKNPSSRGKGTEKLFNQEGRTEKERIYETSRKKEQDTLTKSKVESQRGQLAGARGMRATKRKQKKNQTVGNKDEGFPQLS